MILALNALGNCMEYVLNKFCKCALVFLIVGGSTSVFASWKIKVLYLNSEVKYFEPDSGKDFEIPVDSKISGWNCKFTQEIRSNIQVSGTKIDRVQRGIICNNGRKGSIVIPLTCLPNTAGVVFPFIMSEDRQKFWVIEATCSGV